MTLPFWVLQTIAFFALSLVLLAVLLCLFDLFAKPLARRLERRRRMRQVQPFERWPSHRHLTRIK